MWGNRSAVPTFHISLENTGRFIALLCKALPDAWERERPAECYFREKDPNPVFIFVKESAAPSLEPHVTIRRTAPDEWQASEVTIHQGRWFSDDECAAELKEFETALVAAASKIGSTVEFVSEHPDSGRVLKSAAAGALWWRFVSEADPNPVPGTDPRQWDELVDKPHLNPLSQENLRGWDEFSVQAYRDETALDDGVLDEWLHAAGFPGSIRQHLVAQYKRTSYVLSAYEEMKVGA